MSTREKRLVIILGIFAVGGLGLGVYSLVLSPLMESRAAAATLENELNEKTKTLADLDEKKKRLKDLYARSLPADPDVAQREYGALLRELLRDTKMPNGCTVQEQKAADESRVPTLSAKTPAFSRSAYIVTLRKVDLPKVVSFLEAYYRQPVLQQIARFSIKKTGSDENGAKKSESRSDLEVTIVTEGVSIDGAAKRETLLPAPPAFGALGGSLAMGFMEYSPQLSQVERQFSPWIPVNNLAAGRNYNLLVAKDPFHGPLPDLIKESKGGKKPDEVPPPPIIDQEDISPYIRLTGITWRSDGTISAEIRDMANNNDYDVNRKTTKYDGTKVSVRKYFYIGTLRKPYPEEEYLIIHEDGTATDRKFKVLDFLPEGLLLSERPIAAAKIEELPKEEKKESKGGSSRGGSKSGGKPSTTRKAEPAKGPQQLGAMVGGLAFVEVRPPEDRYLWPIGARLSEIKKLPAEPKKSEEAPMPRENPLGK